MEPIRYAMIAVDSTAIHSAGADSGSDCFHWKLTTNKTFETNVIRKTERSPEEKLILSQQTIRRRQCETAYTKPVHCESA